jgi:prolyl-tRNA editing enzyme YbaK/EbsC (Cys-tRNA(Pro) deacylase)
MSLESVRAFLAEKASDLEIKVLDSSTATVALAAEGHGVTHGQIAKTLAFRVGAVDALLVTAGDARLDNKKAKAAFGGKVKLIPLDEVEQITGHPAGGVCPFGLLAPMPIYFDLSLQAYEEVVPAAGSTNSAVRINTLRMASLVDAVWVDACQ